MTILIQEWSGKDEKKGINPSKNLTKVKNQDKETPTIPIPHA